MIVEVVNQKNEIVGQLEVPQDEIDIVGIAGKPYRVYRTPETNQAYIVIGDC